MNHKTSLEKCLFPRLFLKAISVFVVVAFLCSDLLVFPSQALAQSTPLTSPQGGYDTSLLASASATSGKVQELVIPPELGKIDEISFANRRAESGGRRAQQITPSAILHPPSDFVFLIQDAHSIPDAQRSLEKLVEYLQGQYGVATVALEGAEGQLDPTLFRMFPDAEKRAAVFGDLIGSGELSGAAMASVLSPYKAEYVGVENWKLYQEGVAAFLAGLGKQPEVNAQRATLNEELKRLKAKYYSSEAKEFDARLAAWNTDPSQLAGFLEYLSKFSRGNAQSATLNALFETLKSEKIRDPKLEAEVKRFAQYAHEVAPSAKLNSLVQDYKTGSLALAALAYELSKMVSINKPVILTSRGLATARETEESQKRDPSALPQDDTNVVISSQLRALIANHEELLAMKGPAFSKEFDAFLAKVESALFTSPETQEIARLSRKLDLLGKLVRFELTREEWNELKLDGGWRMADGVSKQEIREFSKKVMTVYRLPLTADSSRFYEIALKREAVFLTRLSNLLKAPSSIHPPPSVICVTGGFHTDGLAAKLKEQGISYAVISPAIKEIPKDNRYLEQMQGKVSWASYFRPRDGRIDLYDAFARAASEKLVASPQSSGNSSRTNRGPWPVAHGPILKEWRDDIIRGLAAEGRVSEHAKYTRYIDQRAAERSPEFQSLKTTWTAKLEKFIEKLQLLGKNGQITEANIAKLLAQPANQTPYAVNLVPGVSVPVSFAWGSGLVPRDPEEPVTAEYGPVRVERGGRLRIPEELRNKYPAPLLFATPRLSRSGAIAVRTREVFDRDFEHFMLALGVQKNASGYFPLADSVHSKWSSYIGSISADVHVNAQGEMDGTMKQTFRRMTEEWRLWSSVPDAFYFVDRKTFFELWPAELWESGSQVVAEQKKSSSGDLSRSETRINEASRDIVFKNPNHMHVGPSAVFAMFAKYLRMLRNIDLEIQTQKSDKVPVKDTVSIVKLGIQNEDTVRIFARGPYPEKVLESVLKKTEQLMQNRDAMEGGGGPGAPFNVYAQWVETIPTNRQFAEAGSVVQTTGAGVIEPPLRVSVVIGATLGNDLLTDQLRHYLEAPKNPKIHKQILITVDARSRELHRERFEILQQLVESLDPQLSGLTIQLIAEPGMRRASDAVKNGIAASTGEAVILADERAPLSDGIFGSLVSPILQSRSDVAYEASGLYTAVRARTLKEVKLSGRIFPINEEIKAKLKRLAYTSETVSALASEGNQRLSPWERIRTAVADRVYSFLPSGKFYRGQYEFEKSMEAMAKLPRLPGGERRKVSVVIASRSGKRLFSPDEESEGQDALRIKVAEQLQPLFALNPSYDWELVIVDDATPGGKTGKRILKKAEALFPDYVKSGKIRVAFSQETKSQKGGGILFGMKDALEHHADYVVYTDVDLSADLRLIGSLLERIVLGGTGIVIGSRDHPRSRVVGRGLFRDISSAFYHGLVCSMLPLRKIFDTQSGFKAFSREAALATVPEVKDIAMSFDTEFLVLGQEKGFTIEEVPIFWKDSQVGTSISILMQMFRMTEGLLGQRVRMLQRRLLQSRTPGITNFLILLTRVAIAGVRVAQRWLRTYLNAKKWLTNLSFSKPSATSVSPALQEAKLEEQTVKDLSAIARSIVGQAGRKLADYRKRLADVAVRNKLEPGTDNATLVTEADEAVQRFIISEIQKLFTDHFVIAEEKIEDEVLRKNRENENADFVWVLDPIDGTKEFLKPESDFYAISLALFYKGQPVLAVVQSPYAGVIEASADRSGVYWNGKEARVSGVSDRRELHAVIDDATQEVLPPITVIEEGWKSVAHGTRSVVLNLARIALSGDDPEAPALFWKGGNRGPALWDIAGSTYLLKKAGGVALCVEGGAVLDAQEAVSRAILDPSKRAKHFSILAGTPAAMSEAAAVMEKVLSRGMADSTKSEDLVVEKATLPEKIDAIRAHYALEIPEKPVAHPIGHAVKPQQPVLVESKQGTFVLKRIGDSLQRAQFVVSYQKQLNQKGIRAVPRLVPLKGRSGEIADDFLLKLSDGYYVLEEGRFEGVELGYRDAQPRQFEAVGMLIATLQNATEGFAPEGRKNEEPLIGVLKRQRDFESLGTVLRIKERVPGGKALARGQKLFIENLPMLLSQMEILRTDLSEARYEALPKALAPMDVSFHNIRFGGDGSTPISVYDFGKLRYQARLEDLKNPAMSVGPEKGRTYDRAALDAIVRGYQSAIHTPLTSEELAALPDFIRGTFLWQYAGWFLLEMSKLNTDDALYQQARSFFDDFRKFSMDFPAGRSFAPGTSRSESRVTELQAPIREPRAVVMLMAEVVYKTFRSFGWNGAANFLVETLGPKFLQPEGWPELPARTGDALKDFWSIFYTIESLRHIAMDIPGGKIHYPVEGPEDTLSWRGWIDHETLREGQGLALADQQSVVSVKAWRLGQVLAGKDPEKSDAEVWDLLGKFHEAVEHTADFIPGFFISNEQHIEDVRRKHLDWAFGFMGPLQRLKKANLSNWFVRKLLIDSPHAFSNAVVLREAQRRILELLPLFRAAAGRIMDQVAETRMDRFLEAWGKDVVVPPPPSKQQALSKVMARVGTLKGRSVVLIGGTSASGKTELVSQLKREWGHRMVVMPLDDYFKSRTEMVRHADGTILYDHPDSSRLDLAEKHIRDLLAGETIELPSYDMKTGIFNEHSGRKFQLAPEDILVVESIHALHPKVISAVGKAPSLKLFMKTPAPIRLLRRLKRDTERGYSYEATLKFWPYLNELERTFINPTRRTAEAVLFSYDTEEAHAVEGELRRLLNEELRRQQNAPEFVASVQGALDSLSEAEEVFPLGQQLISVGHIEMEKFEIERNPLTTEVIAIDGPMGTGKDAAAKALAKKRGSLFLHPGIFYSALAEKALSQGITFHDRTKIEQLLADTRFYVWLNDGKFSIYRDGADVTDKVWEPEVSRFAALLGKYWKVHQSIFQTVRRIGEKYNLVVYGGNCARIFSDTRTKLYLKARMDQRIFRKQKEYQPRGLEFSAKEIWDILESRDALDQQRLIEPVAQAPDAEAINTSDLSTDEIVELMEEAIQRQQSTPRSESRESNVPVAMLRVAPGSAKFLSASRGGFLKEIQFLFGAQHLFLVLDAEGELPVLDNQGELHVHGQTGRSAHLRYDVYASDPARRGALGDQNIASLELQFNKKGQVMKATLLGAFAEIVGPSLNTTFRMWLSKLQNMTMTRDNALLTPPAGPGKFQLWLKRHVPDFKLALTHSRDSDFGSRSTPAPDSTGTAEERGATAQLRQNLDGSARSEMRDVAREFTMAQSGSHQLPITVLRKLSETCLSALGIEVFLRDKPDSKKVAISEVTEILLFDLDPGAEKEFILKGDFEPQVLEKVADVVSELLGRCREQFSVFPDDVAGDAILNDYRTRIARIVKNASGTEAKGLFEKLGARATGFWSGIKAGMSDEMVSPAQWPQLVEVLKMTLGSSLQGAASELFHYLVLHPVYGPAAKTFSMTKAGSFLISMELRKNFQVSVEILKSGFWGISLEIKVPGKETLERYRSMSAAQSRLDALAQSFLDRSGEGPGAIGEKRSESRDISFSRTTGPILGGGILEQDWPETKRVFRFLNGYNIHERPSGVLADLASKISGKLQLYVFFKKGELGPVMMSSPYQVRNLNICYDQDVEILVKGEEPEDIRQDVAELVERAMQDGAMLEEEDRDNPRYGSYLEELDRIRVKALAETGHVLAEDGESKTWKDRLAIGFKGLSLGAVVALPSAVVQGARQLLAGKSAVDAGGGFTEVQFYYQNEAVTGNASIRKTVEQLMASKQQFVFNASVSEDNTLIFGVFPRKYKRSGEDAEIRAAHSDIPRPKREFGVLECVLFYSEGAPMLILEPNHTGQPPLKQDFQKAFSDLVRMSRFMIASGFPSDLPLDTGTQSDIQTLFTEGFNQERSVLPSTLRALSEEEIPETDLLLRSEMRGGREEDAATPAETLYEHKSSNEEYSAYFEEVMESLDAVNLGVAAAVQVMTSYLRRQRKVESQRRRQFGEIGRFQKDHSRIFAPLQLLLGHLGEDQVGGSLWFIARFLLSLKDSGLFSWSLSVLLATSRDSKRDPVVVRNAEALLRTARELGLKSGVPVSWAARAVLIVWEKQPLMNPLDLYMEKFYGEKRFKMADEVIYVRGKRGRDERYMNTAQARKKTLERMRVQELDEEVVEALADFGGNEEDLGEGMDVPVPALPAGRRSVLAPSVPVQLRQELDAPVRSESRKEKEQPIFLSHDAEDEDSLVTQALILIETKIQDIQSILRELMKPAIPPTERAALDEILQSLQVMTNGFYSLSLSQEDESLQGERQQYLKGVVEAWKETGRRFFEYSKSQTSEEGLSRVRQIKDLLDMVADYASGMVHMRIRRPARSLEDAVQTIVKADDLADYTGELVASINRTRKREGADPVSLSTLTQNPEEFEADFFAPMYRLFSMKLQTDFKNTESFIEEAKRIVAAQGVLGLREALSRKEGPLLDLFKKIRHNGADRFVSIDLYGQFIFFLTDNFEDYFGHIYDELIQTRPAIAIGRKYVSYHARAASTIDFREKMLLLGEDNPADPYRQDRDVSIFQKPALDQRNSAHAAKLRKAIEIWKARAAELGSEEMTRRIEGFEKAMTWVKEFSNKREGDEVSQDLAGQLPLIIADAELNTIRVVHTDRMEHTLYFSAAYLESLDIHDPEDMKELAIWLNVSQKWLDLAPVEASEPAPVDLAALMSPAQLQDLEVEALRRDINDRFFEQEDTQLISSDRLKARMAALERQHVINRYQTFMDKVIQKEEFVAQKIREGKRLIRELPEHSEWDPSSKVRDPFRDAAHACNELLLRYEAMGMRAQADRVFRLVLYMTSFVQFYDKGGLLPWSFQEDLIFIALRLGYWGHFLNEVSIYLKAREASVLGVHESVLEGFWRSGFPRAFEDNNVLEIENYRWRPGNWFFFRKLQSVMQSQLKASLPELFPERNRIVGEVYRLIKEAKEDPLGDLKREFGMERDAKRSESRQEDGVTEKRLGGSRSGAHMLLISFAIGVVAVGIVIASPFLSQLVRYYGVHLTMEKLRKPLLGAAFVLSMILWHLVDERLKSEKFAWEKIPGHRPLPKDIRKFFEKIAEEHHVRLDVQDTREKESSDSVWQICFRDDQQRRSLVSIQIQSYGMGFRGSFWKRVGGSDVLLHPEGNLDNFPYISDPHPGKFLEALKARIGKIKSIGWLGADSFSSAAVGPAVLVKDPQKIKKLLSSDLEKTGVDRPLQAPNDPRDHLQRSEMRVELDDISKPFGTKLAVPDGSVSYDLENAKEHPKDPHEVEKPWWIAAGASGYSRYQSWWNMFRSLLHVYETEFNRLPKYADARVKLERWHGVYAKDLLEIARLKMQKLRGKVELIRQKLAAGDDAAVRKNSWGLRSVRWLRSEPELEPLVNLAEQVNRLANESVSRHKEKIQEKLGKLEERLALAESLLRFLKTYHEAYYRNRLTHSKWPHGLAREQSFEDSLASFPEASDAMKLLFFQFVYFSREKDSAAVAWLSKVIMATFAKKDPDQMMLALNEPERIPALVEKLAPIAILNALIRCLDIKAEPKLSSSGKKAAEASLTEFYFGLGMSRPRGKGKDLLMERLRFLEASHDIQWPLNGNEIRIYEQIERIVAGGHDFRLVVDPVTHVLTGVDKMEASANLPWHQKSFRRSESREANHTERRDEAPSVGAESRANFITPGDTWAGRNDGTLRWGLNVLKRLGFDYTSGPQKIGVVGTGIVPFDVKTVVNWVKAERGVGSLPSDVSVTGFELPQAVPYAYIHVSNKAEGFNDLAAKILRRYAISLEDIKDIILSVRADKEMGSIVLGYRDHRSEDGATYKTIAVAPDQTFVVTGEQTSDERYRNMELFDAVRNWMGKERFRRFVESQEDRDEGGIRIEFDPHHRFCERLGARFIPTKDLSTSGLSDMTLLTAFNVLLHMDSKGEEAFIAQAGSVLKDGRTDAEGKVIEPGGVLLVSDLVDNGMVDLGHLGVLYSSPESEDRCFMKVNGRLTRISGFDPEYIDFFGWRSGLEGLWFMERDGSSFLTYDPSAYQPWVPSATVRSAPTRNVSVPLRWEQDAPVRSESREQSERFVLVDAVPEEDRDSVFNELMALDGAIMRKELEHTSLWNLMWKPESIRDDDIRKALEGWNSAVQYWIAREPVSGRIAGILIMEHKKTEEAWVKWLMVHPDFWESGVGAQLMATAFEAARNAGEKELRLETLAANSRARKFYRNLPARIDGITVSEQYTGSEGGVTRREPAYMYIYTLLPRSAPTSVSAPLRQELGAPVPALSAGGRSELRVEETEAPGRTIQSIAREAFRREIRPEAIAILADMARDYREAFSEKRGEGEKGAEWDYIRSFISETLRYGDDPAIVRPMRELAKFFLSHQQSPSFFLGTTVGAILSKTRKNSSAFHAWAAVLGRALKNDFAGTNALIKKGLDEEVKGMKTPEDLAQYFSDQAGVREEKKKTPAPALRPVTDTSTIATVRTAAVKRMQELGILPADLTAELITVIGTNRQGDYVLQIPGVNDAYVLQKHFVIWAARQASSSKSLEISEDGGTRGESRPETRQPMFNLRGGIWVGADQKSASAYLLESGPSEANSFTPANKAESVYTGVLNSVLKQESASPETVRGLTQEISTSGLAKVEDRLWDALNNVFVPTAFAEITETGALAPAYESLDRALRDQKMDAQELEAFAEQVFEGQLKLMAESIQKGEMGGMAPVIFYSPEMKPRLLKFIGAIQQGFDAVGDETGKQYQITIVSEDRAELQAFETDLSKQKLLRGVKLIGKNGAEKIEEELASSVIDHPVYGSKFGVFFPPSALGKGIKEWQRVVYPEVPTEYAMILLPALTRYFASFKTDELKEETLATTLRQALPDLFASARFQVGQGIVIVAESLQRLVTAARQIASAA